MTPAREAASLTLRALSKRFGAQLAVSEVDLHVEPGEMIVLLGPSGCGKTTTLRMIAGFLTASSGDIMLDGTSILGVPTHERDMGIVFQSYALFPHLTRGAQRALRAGDAADGGGRRRRARRGDAAAGEAREFRRPLAAQPVGRPAAARGAGAGAWRSIRGCFCWTSRCRTSTRRCARTWRARSASCNATAGSPRSS